MHWTSEQGQSRLCFLPLIVQNRHNLPSRNVCVNGHFTDKLMVWGSPLVSTAEHMSYRSVKLSVWPGLLLDENKIYTITGT